MKFTKPNESIKRVRGKANYIESYFAKYINKRKQLKTNAYVLLSEITFIMHFEYYVPILITGI